MIDLYRGDCLELMKDIPDNSIDMVLTWVKIKKYPNYLISNNGDIYNLKNGRFKKPCLDKKGYERTRLSNNGVAKTLKVHRIVAEAFLPNYCKDLQVNHKNCVKHDNRLENLEMVTQSENTKHAWKNKRMKLTKRDEYGKFTKGE